MSKSAKSRYEQLIYWLKGYKSSPVSNFRKQQEKKKSNYKGKR